jgi:hypothetical protein
MNSVTANFQTFFGQAFAQNGSQPTPFDYQTRLATATCLPEILNVPTGAGNWSAAKRFCRAGGKA